VIRSGRHADAPSENVGGALGDFVIRRLFVRRKPDFEVLRDRAHAEDVLVGSLGGQFVGIAWNRTRQRDDGVMNADRDIRGIKAGFEIELLEDVLAQFVITDHVDLHASD